MADRISNLPQHILHHILSFLSDENAVQTSVLSKSWRYLVSTRPKFEFRRSPYQQFNSTDISSLDKALQRYHDQNLSIHQFIIDIKHHPLTFKSISLLEKWVPIVVTNMGAKTLSLSLDFENAFVVPSAVLRSEFLEELYLSHCQLKPVEKLSLKRLQKLSLLYVSVNEETFEKIMSSCPLIEYLVLVMCYGLRTNKVNTNDISERNLKHFELPHNSRNHGDCSVNVCPNWFNKPNLYFTNLKSLYLKNICLWAIKSFDSSKFPCLEDLTLENCYGFEEFKLSSCSIKRLAIIYPGEAIKATIDAPNILYFKYKGVYLQSSFFFTTTSHEWESYIHLCGFLEHLDDRGCSPSWLYGIDELLKGFRQSKISMHISECFEDRNMTEIVLLDISSFEQLVVVEKLTIDNGTSMCLRAIMQCLFRIIRPTYIVEHLYKYHDEDIRQHIESLRKKVVAWRESGTHFWQQDLEDVIMEGARSMLPENRNYIPKLIEIGFRLKWRETEMSPNSNIWAA